MNDILKIIVDAELKKNTSLESAMDSLLKKYETVEVGVGIDKKTFKDLQDTIKGLQEQVNKLQGELSKGIKEGFKEGAKGAKQLNEDMKEVLKTTEKINKEGAKTSKVVTGDKTGFKKVTTTTNGEGEFVSQEVVLDYKKLVSELEKLKARKDMLLEDKEFKEVDKALYGDGKKVKAIQDLSTDSAREKRFEKFLSLMDELKKKNEDLNAQNKIALQQQKDKNKAVQDEVKSWAEYLAQRPSDPKENASEAKSRIDQARKESTEDQKLQDQLWTAKQQREAELRGMQIDMWKQRQKEGKDEAKEVNAVLDQRAKAWQEHEDYKQSYSRKKEQEQSQWLEQQAKEIIKKRDADFKAEENRIVKNMEKMNEKTPFVNNRLYNVSKFVDDNEKDFIKTDQFDKVHNMFEKLNVEAVDFKTQLKLAEDELKKMEKHAQGLSNLQDAQNDTRKQMNLDIKKDRNNENANMMLARGNVPKELIDGYKKLSEAMELSSTKKDIEEVNKQWRHLLAVEKELVGVNREKTKEEKAQQDNLDKLLKGTRQLSSALTDLENSAERSFNKMDIKPNQFGEIKSKIQEVNAIIDRIRTSQDSLSDEQKASVNARIKEIQREIQKYKDLEQAIDQAHSQANRIDMNQRRQGTLSGDYTSGFNFDELNKGDYSANQKKIQSQITALTKEIIKQNGEYGKLDETMVRVRPSVDALGNEIYKVSYTVDRGNRNFEDYNLTLDATNRRISDLGQSMKQLRPEMTAMERLYDAITKVPVWATATGIIYGAVAQVQMGFQMLLDFDKEMTELKKVASESRDELIAFESDALSLGQKLGATGAEVAGATAEFARLGYALKESKALAETALVYANVGDMGFEDASKNLISALKGFGVAEADVVSESRRYADMFNEVGNNFAIDSAGIGEALKRSSAVLHQAGNSVEQSVALITSANTTIQDPKKVGNALKTISMRLRGVDEEGKAVAQLVPELEKYFNQFGSSLMSSEGTFKTTYEMMNELHDGWEKLTDMEQAQLIELIGGKEQGSIVSAMIENWGDAIGSYETALDSAGSAQREFNEYTDSYAYKIDRLKNSTEDFWHTFLDQNTVKNAIDGLNALVRAMTSFTESFGMIPVIVSLFSTLALMMHPAVRGMVLLNGATMTVGKAMGGLRVAMTGLIGVLRGFMAFNLPLLALSVGIELVTGAIMAQARAREEHLRVMRDEYEQTQQTIDAYDRLADAGDMGDYDTISRKANNGVSLSVEERQKLVQVEEELMGLTNGLVDHYDSEGRAIYKTTEQLQALIDKKKEEQRENGLKLAKEEIDQADFGNNKIFKDEGIMRTVKDINDLQNALSDFKKMNNEDGVGIIESFFENELKAVEDKPKRLQEEIQNVMEEIQKSMSEDEFNNFSRGEGMMILSQLANGLDPEEARKLFDNFLSSFNERKDEFGSKLDELRSELTEKTSELQPHIKALVDEFALDNNIDTNTNTFKFIELLSASWAQGLVGLDETEAEFREYMLKYPEVIDEVLNDINSKEGIDMEKLFANGGSEEQINLVRQVASAYKDGSDKANVMAQVVDLLTNALNAQKQSVDGVAQSFEASASDLNKWTEQYDTAVSNISFLNQALEELKEHHNLSADVVSEISNRYPQLLAHMGNEVSLSNAISNAIVDETNTAKSAMEAKMMYNNEFYQKALQQNTQFFQDLQNKYGLDFKGFKNLAEAKAKTTEALLNSMGQGWAKYFRATKEGMLEINNAAVNTMLATNDGALSGAKVAKYKQIQSKLQSANNYLSSISTSFSNIALTPINVSTNFSRLGVGAPKKEKEPDKPAEPDYQDWMDAFIRQRMMQAERLDMQEEEIKNRIKMFEDEENMGKVIEENNNLLVNRKARLAELKNVNVQLGGAMSIYNQSWVDENGEATLSYINSYNSSSKEQQESMQRSFDQLSKLKKQYSENSKEIADLNYEVISLSKSIEELRVEKLKDDMDKLTDSIDEAYDAFSRLKKQVEREFAYLDEGDDAGRVALIKKRMDLLYQERQIMSNNIAQLQAQRATLAGQPELLKENAEAITQWQEALKDLNLDIIDSQNEVKDIYEELADEVIEMYKDAIERQRDAELDAIDDIEDAEKERHENRMKHLDDEMEQFEKSIQQQLDAIDQKEDEDDFNEQLNDKQIERQKTIDLISKYSMDNTAEGRKQLALLKEQLAQQEEELEKFVHDRQVTLRKDALQQELDAKRQQMEQIKSEEDIAHEEKLAKYEQERTDLNFHYENMLADERRWQQIRTDIMNENFDNIRNQMQSFAQTVSQSAKDMGQNIADNIINNLQKAIDLMNKLEQDKLKAEEIKNKPPQAPPAPAPAPTPAPTPTPASGGSSGSSGGSSSGSSSGGSSSGGVSASSLPLRKRNGGFAVPRGGWDKYSVVDYLKSKSYFADFSDREKLYKHFFGSGSGYSGTNAQNTNLLNKLKNVTGLRSGGMTPAWGNSGKLAFLHEKELVLNKMDTSNMLETVNAVRDIMKITPRTSPISTAPSLEPNQMGNGDVILHFNIDRLEGGEKGAKTLVTKVVDTLKRKGVR